MLESLGNLKLTKKLQNSLWLLVRLLCDCIFRIQNRLYLHPCHHGAGHFEQLLLPYGFHCHSVRLKQYILVVEPSPEFPHRSLAADYPLCHPHHFHTLTLTVSSYVVVDKALGSSSNSPSNPLIRYQIRRPSIIISKVVIHLEAFDWIEPTLLVLLEKGQSFSFVPSFLSPCLRHGYEILQQLSFQKMYLSC